MMAENQTSGGYIMSREEELIAQIKEWRRQQEMLDDMIEEAYKRIDEIKSKGDN
jgi:hypothetical protein